MGLFPALVLCVATPLLALYLAPQIFRWTRKRRSDLGLAITAVLAVSGPITAIMTVNS